MHHVEPVGGGIDIAELSTATRHPPTTSSITAPTANTAASEMDIDWIHTYN